jgi:hypothetical protein
VDKTVEEIQQVLVKVPVFNPLHTEEVRKLKLLPIPTVMTHLKLVNDVEDDSDDQILEQLGENEVEMRQDEDPVQEVQSSSRTRSSGGRLTRSSSRRGDTVTLASRIVNSHKSGWSMLRYFPSVGNFYGTVKRYNLSKVQSIVVYLRQGRQLLVFQR